jgi:two-component system nitrogen regulation response regulator GlnG
MAHSDPILLPVVLVDDERLVLDGNALRLRMSGVASVLTLDDSRKVLPLLAAQSVGLLVLDLTMPHVSGQELLAQVTEEHPDVPVIVMTATSDLATAIHCMQTGAIDYLLKPVEPSRLVSAVKRGLEMRSLRTEVHDLRESLLSDGLRQPEAFAEILTQSKAMLAVFRYVEAVARSSHPVLITGESGTGKELIAKALHRLSGRPGELVSDNIAAIPDTHLVDRLFGHTKGAFAGADRALPGLVNRAANGTLFLDEIGDLSAESQVMLLRLLQTGDFYALGSDRPQQSQARVILATHCDVEGALEAKRFRKDLYYRLSAHRVHLPPLRKREGDIPLLVHHFVEQAAHAYGKAVPTVPQSLLQLLGGYSWPGNVRQLQLMCDDAVVQHQGGVLSSQSFKDKMGGAAVEPSEGRADGQRGTWLPDPLPTLSEANRLLIEAAMERAGGNQGVAAGILGITRQALNKRLVRQKLAEPDDEE